MTCVHYRPIEGTDGGRCAVDAYGKGVMVGPKVCRSCPQYDGPVRGVGDLIHKVALPIARALKADCLDETKKHLRPDSDCQKRREALNK